MNTTTNEVNLKIKARIIKARKQRHESQTTFWKRLGVTQSGGSRYESTDGAYLRNIPGPVITLFELVYGNKPVARLAKLRGVTVADLVAAG